MSTESLPRAEISQHGQPAGVLQGLTDGTWTFTYSPAYTGQAVSLTLPLRREPYQFTSFPSIFEGLLPEGPQLETLLRKHKIDRNDPFRQLVTVGEDLVGSLTVREITAAS